MARSNFHQLRDAAGLLPALDNSEQRLKNYRQETEEWFYKEFKGALGLNLAWIYCSESGLAQGYGDTIKSVMEKLAVKKQQAFRYSLTSGKRWRTASFVLPPFGKNERACRSLGNPGLNIYPQGTVSNHPTATGEGTNTGTRGVCYRYGDRLARHS